MPPSPENKITVEPLPITEYYGIIRSQIEHEDNLTGQRLNWFITSQSFFFSAYAIVVTNMKTGSLPMPTNPSDTRLRLVMLIPMVAMIVSAVILLTIAAGVMATHNLRGMYREHKEKARQFDLPPIQGFRRTWAAGMTAPLVLPVVFLAVWTYLLVHGLQ